MAELTSEERLQPSLLDRLVDDAPDAKVESRELRVLSLERLRACVLRDLEWLFNTANLESCGADLAATPRVADSVLNFGMRPLAGASYSNLDVRDVEARMHACIVKFEPRILPDTLEVKVALGGGEYHHNAVVFEIHGVLWADQAQEQLFLKTRVDLETGGFSIDDMAR